MASAKRKSLDALQQRWVRAWPKALARWSRFTKLSQPRWCLTSAAAKKHGLSGSFAMIRLTDQAVVIDLEQVRASGVEEHAEEILAHEIGHHVYCPANLLDQGRMIARMRYGLPSKEHLAPFVANLYADLHINDRLQRREALDMAGVYRQLGGGSKDRLWTFYMRIYEILWSLPRGSLAKAKGDDALQGDAGLGARLIRSYARDPVAGSGRFAALCLTYLLDDDGKATRGLLRGLLDTVHSGAGGKLPPGLAEIDSDEIDGAIHPALDPAIAGIDVEGERDGDASDRKGPPIGATGPGGSAGQYREPFEYGAILRSLGMDLSDHEIAVRYYRERALPHLVPFPMQLMPEATDPLPEGLDLWDVGERIEAIDWLQTVMRSPHVIPGVTTVQRQWGTTAGAEPDKRPMDLDLYVDCSGSMPNPQRQVSYTALAGAIVVLSALRVGARVQATLWSGAGQFQTTGGFTRDATAVLRILTGFIGGGTAFPIHILRDTYADRRPSDRPAHVLVVSDDGVTTMFSRDEKGNSGWDVARSALEKGAGGGTLVLQLYRPWRDNDMLVKASEQGWQVHRVNAWDDLVAFARAFSTANYADGSRVERTGA